MGASLLFGLLSGQSNANVVPTITFNPPAPSYDLPNTVIGTSLPAFSVTGIIDPAGITSYSLTFTLNAGGNSEILPLGGINAGLNFSVNDIVFAPTILGQSTLLISAVFGYQICTATCINQTVSSALTIYGTGIAAPSEVPVPAALPLLASGLGALGFAGWRRSKKTKFAA